MSEKTPEYWREVGVGDQITVSDTQAIEDSMKQGAGVNGLEYTVDSIKSISVADGAGEYLIFNLQEGGDQELFLMAKIVDKEIDLRLFFEIVDFESGDRQDMLETDRHWLFEEPENINEFDFLDLEYSNEVESPDEVVYSKKMTLNGDATIDPLEDGMAEEYAVTVTEYSTTEEAANTELLILEEGGDTRGGLIKLYAGTDIGENDVDVFHVVDDDEYDD